MVGQIGRCSPSCTEGPHPEGVLCPLDPNPTEGANVRILRVPLYSYKGRLHHLCKVTDAFLPRALMRSYNERSRHLCKVMRVFSPSVFPSAWYIPLIALLICDI